MMMVLNGEEFEELVADAEHADELIEANDALEAQLQAREAEIAQLKAQLVAAGQFAAQRQANSYPLTGWYNNPLRDYQGYAQAQAQIDWPAAFGQKQSS